MLLLRYNRHTRGRRNEQLVIQVLNKQRIHFVIIVHYIRYGHLAAVARLHTASCHRIKVYAADGHVCTSKYDYLVYIVMN